VKLDENKMDIRVFLIPHRESTLGHYLAMYDDLYCQNIYNFFNSNTLIHSLMKQHSNVQGDDPFEKLADVI
jgi:hypothetical protein